MVGPEAPLVAGLVDRLDQSDIRVFGPKPGGTHLTTLLLHVAATLLLFASLRRLTGAVWRSALVAALFAWHPLHVESVAWVAERKDVLSGTFWMLTLWVYAAYSARPSTWRYLGVAASLALGLMAKPMLVTLPFVLLLLDYWPLRRFERGRVRALVLEKLPHPCVVQGIPPCVEVFLHALPERELVHR